MKRYFLITLILLILPVFSHAQTGVMQDQITRERARVLEVLKRETETLPGTDVKSGVQGLSAEILEGPEQGKIITLDNDYLNLKSGDIFFLLKTVWAEDKSVTYAVADPDRLPSLFFFVCLFIVCVFVFGGLPGIRGLASLVASLALIVFVLLPGILHGYSPILVSIGVASLIIVLGSYITHGFNKTTSSAVLGMIVTVIITGLLAYIAVHVTKLSGFETEEAAYLNLNTRGGLDLQGLLLGGLLIGLLGVLYDVAIGQAIAVEELHRLAPHVSRATIFRRSLRIGREHTGALVNTLAIAYVGVSLPLLLLFFSDKNLDFLATINREIFATEIIRTMIGSIGLVLAVPTTTSMSVFMLIKKDEHKRAVNSEEIKKETEKLERVGHHH